MSNDLIHAAEWLRAKLDTSGDCWLFTGNRDLKLGVKMRATTGVTRAHTLAWVLAHGPVPVGLEVRHTCGVWTCCRPEHLFLNDPTTGKPRVRRDPQERFWEKVDTSGACWVWTAGRNEAGYGVFGWEHDDVWLAHRLAWLLYTGDDPGDLAVLHTCDNPPCVRREHLFLGTRGDNHRDMVGKGHAPWQNGERWGARGRPHHMARLTESDVQALRHIATRWGVPGAELARWAKLEKSTVQKMLRRETWKHVADLPS